MTPSANDDGQCCRQTLSDQSYISALCRSDSDARVHTTSIELVVSSKTPFI